jgi:hypothetical protein
MLTLMIKVNGYVYLVFYCLALVPPFSKPCPHVQSLGLWDNDNEDRNHLAGRMLESFYWPYGSTSCREIMKSLSLFSFSCLPFREAYIKNFISSDLGYL